MMKMLQQPVDPQNPVQTPISSIQTIQSDTHPDVVEKLTELEAVEKAREDNPTEEYLALAAKAQEKVKEIFLEAERKCTPASSVPSSPSSQSSVISIFAKKIGIFFQAPLPNGKRSSSQSSKASVAIPETGVAVLPEYLQRVVSEAIKAYRLHSARHGILNEWKHAEGLGRVDAIEGMLNQGGYRTLALYTEDGAFDKSIKKGKCNKHSGFIDALIYIYEKMIIANDMGYQYAPDKDKKLPHFTHNYNDAKGREFVREKILNVMHAAAIKPTVEDAKTSRSSSFSSFSSFRSSNSY